MEYPLVSIITVNFNHPEVTCELLNSLQKITYPAIEVIVVDNASDRDDPGCILIRHPWVKFIRSNRNLGFAGGNNLGIRSAKGKYILLLNNDTEVDPGFLEPLVDHCENDPVTGAVSPKIVFSNQPDTIQYAGLTEFNPYTIRNRGLGHGKKDDGQFDRPHITPLVHGAAMLLPMHVIREVGLMAECYFLYYEEHDWASRIRKAGYRLWYIPRSRVLHKESVSTGKLSPLKTYYMNRSRMIYLRRNSTGWIFLIAILYQLLLAFPKNGLLSLIKGRPRHCYALVRAAGWHLTHMFSKELHTQPGL